MNKVSELLNISLDFSKFERNSMQTFLNQISRKISLRIKKLEEINNEYGNKPFEPQELVLIQDIYRKLNELIKRGEEILIDSFNKKELRILSFALNYSENGEKNILSELDILKLVLDALDKNWKYSYLIGLIYCYLYDWTNNLIGKEKLWDFIKTHLNNYNGNRKSILVHKKNIKYYEVRNGDLILGAEIALKGENISDVAKYLALPESYIRHSYFKQVILSFNERKQTQIFKHLKDIKKFLHLHNNIDTNKIVISKLIIQANQSEFEEYQDEIKSYAFAFVGDPSINTNWIPNKHYTELEKEELKSAKKILNEWITRQFVSVFFEKCINDRRRKKFWLKFSKDIKLFTVFGSQKTKNKLKADERVKDYVDSRFLVVNGGEDVSAFMFQIENYKLIEFSNSNYAFYAYRDNNNKVPSFYSREINSINVFRNSKVPMLVHKRGRELFDYKAEGRLTHSDGELRWEEVFLDWIYRKVYKSL